MAGEERRSWKWHEKYKTPKDYYLGEYSNKYYEFGKYEFEIDPDETVEDLEEYDILQQQKEMIKCRHSFAYFCHKFVKIGHPILGLLPFVLFRYQRRVVAEYEQHRFNIIRKFRQGGLTTVTVLWSLWRAMFKKREVLMLLSKTDREAIVAGEIAKTAMDNFPTWFRPSMGKCNDHERHFVETGSKLLFFTPEAARGRSISFLIIDEAAFVKDMDRHWAAIFPTIATGGKCIVVSTVNGIGNWYEETYHGAEEGSNKFHIIDIEFEEHPDYDKPGWAEEMEAQLGKKKFRQEVLGDFLGSGATYIPAPTLKEMKKRTKKIVPLRMHFPEWVNFSKAMKDLDLAADTTGGALWIYREPIEGREYIMGVDCAEGGGDEGDNNCLQIIDQGTMEQVAEFYSNSIPVERFSKVVHQLGVYFNNALIVVENMGPGQTVLSRLQNELFYEHLHYEENNKPGIKVGSHNRSSILEAFQSRILNNTMTLNSIRTVMELETFVYNPLKKRHEAIKGKHDDAIFALSHAIHIRDQLIRQSSPMLGEMPKELKDVFKTDFFTKIKEEILKGAPEDWIDPEDRVVLPDGDEEGDNFQEYYSKHRRSDQILREFGW